MIYNKKTKSSPYKKSNDFLIGGLISAGIGLAGNALNNDDPIADARAAREADASLASTRQSISNANGVMMNSIDSKFAYGGDLNSFENGGSHEENPMGGIPQGTDSEGTQNLVEEGETRAGDYIFSDRIILTPAIVKKYGLPKSYVGKTLADASKDANKEAEERPNDPISNRGKDASLDRLKMASEESKPKEQGEQFAGGGYLDDEPFNKAAGNPYADEDTSQAAPVEIEEDGDSWWKTNKEKVGIAGVAALRLAPAIGSAIGLSKLEKAKETKLGRMTSSVRAKHIDRDSYLSPVVDQRESIIRGQAGASGGDSSAARAGMLASNIGMSKALAQAGTMADQFNIGQDNAAAQAKDKATQVNLQQGNMEADIKARDEGAYQSRKDILEKGIWDSVGGIGKELMESKLVGKATKYNPYTGERIQDKKAMGGLLNQSKYKKLLNI